MKKLLLLLAFGFISFGSFAQLCFAPAATVSQISCNASCDGEISIFTDNNCAPYTFGWSKNNIVITLNGPSTMSNLCPGMYVIAVTDNQVNTSYLTVILELPGQPVISNVNITNNTCDYDCNGSISFNTSSTPYGSGIQGYVWDNGLGSGSGTPVPVTNLCNGTYTITITENSGCDLVKTFNIIPTQPLTVGASYQNNYCANSCTAYINVNASSPSGVSFVWNSGQTTNQINNLCNGTYTVTVTNGAGCTAVRNYTILTDPTINTNWQKNTDNQTGANDVIKRTLTDIQGNLYVMGEFINQTAIDGYLIDNGGINNQKAIFVAKYRPCGDLEWVVNSQNFSSYYDIEGFDIDFTLNQQDVTLFAKWNNSGSEQYSFVSSNGSSNTFNNPGTNRDVFSISFDVGTGTVTTISKNYFLDYSDRLTTGKITGPTSYIGGQIGGQAMIKWYDINGSPSWLSNVIEDLNGGNIIADFEVDGANSYVIAALNLENTSVLFAPSGTTPISNQGDAVVVIAQVFPFSTIYPSFINPAYGSEVTINDVDMNLSTLGNVVTAVGEFKGQLPGWQTGGIQINSNIKTAVIAQFQANNLINTATYQMDGQIQNASAAAVITNPDAITVTGVMNGNQAQITTNSGVIGTNTGSGAGANTMWVARFLYNTANGDWMIGSDGVQDVVVNDISYHEPTGLFYTGGQYMDDILMPPLSNLNFPYPGTGQRLGFIIRGGDQYFGGQGAFYKTSADELPKENIIEAVAGFIIYPNPNNGQFNLEINTEIDEEVQLSIFSLTGQLVFQKIIGNPNKGMSIAVQPDGLSSGFYTIQIQQGNQTMFQKMIIK